MPPKKQSVRSNRCCFTLNNYSEEEVKSVKKWLQDLYTKNCLQYGIVGLEKGEKKNTPHLQGYVHLKTSFLKARDGNVLRWKSFPGLLRAHLESARGSDLDSKAYCSKEEVLVELGEALEKAPCRYSTLLSLGSMSAAAEEDPELYLKSYFALEKHFKRTSTVSFPVVSQLYEWQTDCLKRIVNQGPRKILFVVDSRGGTGKSELCKWMMNFWPTWACQGGKTADLIYSRSKSSENTCVNVFDLARNKDAKFWPYDVMESLKNQWASSTKYDSEIVKFSGLQRVVVFCNVEPLFSCLSADRYDVWSLDAPSLNLQLNDIVVNDYVKMLE